MRMLIIAVLISAVSTPITYARKWTDSTGKYTVEAEFLEMRDGKVQLKTDNGKIISVPMDKLSKVDQIWVEEYLAKPQPKAPSSDPPRSSRKEAKLRTTIETMLSKGRGDHFVLAVSRTELVKKATRVVPGVVNTQVFKEAPFPVTIVDFHRKEGNEATVDFILGAINQPQAPIDWKLIGRFDTRERAEAALQQAQAMYYASQVHWKIE